MVGALTLATATVGGDAVVSAIAAVLQVLFVAFFVRHFGFAIAAMRHAGSDLEGEPVDPGFTPPVTVMVACKNEQAVVADLVESLTRLTYPHDRLQLVVIDDGSDDRTGAILDELAHREPLLSIVHREPGAGGGKSGALNAGLEVAGGEIVVVFDADHTPRRDSVRRLVRHFRDPRVAAVQGRCVIRNPHASPLSRIVSVDYMAGYLVNEYGRQALFELPAYGGANCAVRSTSLRSLGGWNPSTVTEDTDLTLRLVLNGERVRYDVTAVDEEEAVLSVTRYWRQRYRWARGHQQVWRDYRRSVLASPNLGLAEKIETMMFLFAFHIPVASMVGLVVLALWVTGVATPTPPLNVSLLWTLLFLGPLLELGAGLLLARAHRREVAVLLYFLPVFLLSATLCTKAWFDGLVGRSYSWVKTARAGDEPVGVAA